MSPLLGPILAQLVTLGVSDRTEVRRVIADDSYSELATYPRVGLQIDWRHTTLRLAYFPSLTSSLGGTEHYFWVNHAAGLGLSHRWQRTTLSLTESGSYGEVSFRNQAVAPTSTPVAPAGGTVTPPATGGANGMQPGTGNTGANTSQSLALARPVTFASSSTTLTLTDTLSAVLAVSANVSYSISGVIGNVEVGDAGGTGATGTVAAETLYPTVKGPGAQVTASYQPTHIDLATTVVATQLVDSSNGNHAWLLTATETWTHRLSKSTTGSVGSGLSVTRNSDLDGTRVYYSIYPNFLSSILNTTKLGRSTLTLGAGLSAAPFVDPALGLVDPRVSANALASLSQGKFSSSLTGGTALQLHSGSTGALSSVNGALILSYRVGQAVSLDSGVRTAWQSFQAAGAGTGTTTIPISLAVYAGITVGLNTPLSGRR